MSRNRKNLFKEDQKLINELNEVKKNNVIKNEEIDELNNQLKNKNNVMEILYKNIQEIASQKSPIIIEDTNINNKNIIEDDIDDELYDPEDGEELDEEHDEIDLYESEPENYIVYEHPNYHYDKENDDFYDALNELVEEVYDSYDNIIDINNGIVLRIHKKNEEFFSHLFKPKMINREIQTDDIIENIKIEEKKPIIDQIIDKRLRPKENNNEEQSDFSKQLNDIAPIVDNPCVKYVFTKYFDDKDREFLYKNINNKDVLKKFMVDYGEWLMSFEVFDYLLFQLEKCPKTGNLHFQGFFHLLKKMRWKTIDNSEWGNSKTQKMRKSKMFSGFNANYNYCTKSDSQIHSALVWGFWVEKGQQTGVLDKLEELKEKDGKIDLAFKLSNEYAKNGNFFREISIDMKKEKELKILEEKFKDVKLTKPQEFIINKVENQGKRYASVITQEEIEGGFGKNTIKNYLKIKHKDNVFCCTGGASKDILEAYNNEKMVLINYGRSLKKIDYEFIENLKDGDIFKQKYKSDSYFINDIKVVVFCNEKVDYKQMSLDRWEIFDINIKNGTMKYKKPKIIDNWKKAENLEIIEEEFTEDDYKIKSNFEIIERIKNEIKNGKIKDLKLDKNDNILFE